MLELFQVHTPRSSIFETLAEASMITRRRNFTLPIALQQRQCPSADGPDF